MSATLWLPWLASAGFGLLAPRWSRRLPPALATWLLSLGSLLAAVASGIAIALVTFRALAPTRLLTAQGHWSDAVLRQRDPIRPPVAVAAVTVTIVLILAGSWTAWRRVRATAAAFRLAGGSSPTELCVLEAAEPCAFAVPGWRRGRIVVSSGLLRRLDGPQRRALLIHERAHLDYFHHLHQSVVAVAAAINPLLWRVPAAIRLSCERWADEEAGAVTGRATAAQALLQAAVTDRRTASAAVLAAGRLAVLDRIAALERPVPRLRLWRVGLLAALVGTAVWAAVEGMHETEHLFEVAQAAWRAGRH